MTAVQVIACPASALGFADDAGKPEQRRIDCSTVRNAVHKESAAKGSGETAPVWAQRLLGCASAVLQRQLLLAKNRHPNHTIGARTNQMLPQFRPAQLLQK